MVRLTDLTPITDSAILSVVDRKGDNMGKVTDGEFISVEGSEGTLYRVYALGTSKQYCTCPGWRFQQAPPEYRECKHIKALLKARVRV